MSSTLAVLGGLFDPVHKGHVNAALHALELLPVQRLAMVPCHVPNHKVLPTTQPEHRLAMLEIAVANHSQIEVDAIELRSESVSYTVDTLSAFKKRYDTLVFVLGADAFNTLPQWHEWQALFDLTHLCVLSRPGSELSAATLSAVSIDRRRVQDGEQLLASSNGKILICDNFAIDMASQEIRKKLSRGEDVSAELDAGVIRYIDAHGLYRNQ